MQENNSKISRILSITGGVLVVVVLLFNIWLVSAVVKSLGIGGFKFVRPYIFIFSIVLAVLGIFLIRFQNYGTLINKENLQNLGLLVASLIFCLVLLEVILRLFTAAPLYDPIFDFRANQKNEFPYTNQFGFIGDQIPDDWSKRKTIIAVGGSTTYASNWPLLLQKQLQKLNSSFIVQNAGQVGHATPEHILFMKEIAPKIKPKMVILLVGINDVTGANPSTIYDRGGLLSEIFFRSKVFQLIYKYYFILFMGAAWLNRSSYIKIITDDPVPLPLVSISTCKYRIDDQDVKNAEARLPIFKNNIAEIIELAEEQNIKIMFMTQPLLFSEAAHWDNFSDSTKKGDVCIAGSTLWKDLNFFNKTLLDICNMKNIPCLDLANEIPHEQKYFKDQMHFSKIGSQLVAQKAYEFMKNNAEIYNFLKN